MRSRWLRKKELSRLVLHLKNGDSIAGMLAGDHSDGVALQGATYYASGQEEAPTPLAGETWVPKPEILFAQTDKGR